MKQHSNKQTQWQTSLKLTALAAILALTGCGSVTPEPTAQPQLYINPCTATGPTPPAPLPSGSLDICTFGTSGKVTTDFSSIGINNDTANALAIQSDGKIVAVGSSYNGSSPNFAMARYNSNGSLDTSFGTGGKVKTNLGFNELAIKAIAIYPLAIYPYPGWQNSGKIVVAGHVRENSRYYFVVARYNQSGSLDTNFDGDGKLTTAIGTSNYARSLTIQSDGKIVVAGASYDSNDNIDFALARYNPSGSLDTSFDGDGKLTTAIDLNADVANSVAIQSDGKIVVAGYSWNGNYTDFALARYNPSGSLDTSFDGDGKLITSIELGDDEATSVAIQSDGKIMVAGCAHPDVGLARYNLDGSLDTSFGTGGKVITDFGTHECANSVAIQADGKIVVGWGGGNYFSLARYNPSGSLNTSFGTGGKVTTAIGPYSGAQALAIQADGKIVLAGYSESGGNSDFALARYLP